MKIAITLSDDNFSKLEKLRNHKTSQRSKSNQIAWLIIQEWKRLQEEEREKTPAELVAYSKAYAEHLEKLSAMRVAQKAAAVDCGTHKQQEEPGKEQLANAWTGYYHGINKEQNVIFPIWG